MIFSRLNTREVIIFALCGVGKEVVEDLRELVDIPLDDRHPERFNLVLESHKLWVDERAEGLVGGVGDELAHLVEDAREAHGLDPVGLLGAALGLGFHARHVHDVRHEVEEPVGTAFDHAQLPLPLAGRFALLESRHDLHITRTLQDKISWNHRKKS